jgi:hypothetical protein
VISLSLWETTIWNVHNPTNLYSFHKVLLSYSLHKQYILVLLEAKKDIIENRDALTNENKILKACLS